MVPWLQTSHSGRGEQRVVDTEQEEKQHLPRLSGHAGGVTGEFLHGRQHLLTQLEVHRAEVLRPARHTGRLQVHFHASHERVCVCASGE